MFTAALVARSGARGNSESDKPIVVESRAYADSGPTPRNAPHFRRRTDQRTAPRVRARYYTRVLPWHAQIRAWQMLSRWDLLATNRPPVQPLGQRNLEGTHL